MLSPAINKKRKYTVKRWRLRKRNRPIIPVPKTKLFTTIFDVNRASKVVWNHFAINKNVQRGTITQIISEARSIFDRHFETSDKSEGSDDGRYSNRQTFKDQIKFLTEKLENEDSNGNLTFDEKYNVVSIIKFILQSEVELKNIKQFIRALTTTIPDFRTGNIFKENLLLR